MTRLSLHTLCKLHTPTTLTPPLYTTLTPSHPHLSVSEKAGFVLRVEFRGASPHGGQKESSELLPLYVVKAMDGHAP